jgi:hypothetical protein
MMTVIKFGVGACVLGSVAAFVLMPRAHREAATLFSYGASDVAALGAIRSTQSMNLTEISEWDQRIYDRVTDHKLPDTEASRIYAYLRVAQYDGLNLSRRATGRARGSLSPISRLVSCQFFPQDCRVLDAVGASDAYSEALAKMVFANVQARWAEDQAGAHPYPRPHGPHVWSGAEPGVGRETGSWKPWWISSGAEFRVPPPDPEGSATDIAQMREILNAYHHLTLEHKLAVTHWAGGPGTVTPPGQWLQIADGYMEDKRLPFEKVVAIRALLATAIADSVIAAFDSKYTYWVRRPFMRDTSIRTVMPTPNHPSYPAGHGTISGAASTVLKRLFPENAAQWERMAHEATDSRLWGAIHFAIDNERGLTLGEQVGAAALLQAESAGWSAF